MKRQSSGEDPYIALLNIRNTPTEGLNNSPAQRLFGRRTKSMMPTAEANLRPGYPSREAELKVNRRTLSAPSRRRYLKRLHVGNTVRMQPIRTGEKEWRQARVKTAITSQAFEVESDGRCYPRKPPASQDQCQIHPVLQGGVTPTSRHHRSSPQRYQHLKVLLYSRSKSTRHNWRSIVDDQMRPTNSKTFEV